MSLFNTLNTGAAGLGVSSINLSVIGDNIANINTVGYKGSSARFADLLPESVGSLGGSVQVGRGSRLSGMSTTFSQGALTSTGSALDLAITGNGFFQVSGADGDYYTRDGSFYLDQSGFMVNSQGLRVQGFTANDGSLTSLPGDMQIDTSPIPHSATSEVALNITLAGDDDVIDSSDSGVADATLDGQTETIAEMADAADYSTSITIYDSLGVGHDATVLFEKASDGSWSWTAVVDGSEIDGLDDDEANEGMAFAIAGGDLSFDEDGALVSATSTDLTGGDTFVGADAISVDFLFGKDSAGDDTDGGLQESGSESFVTSVSQDGYATGNLTTVDVSDDGTIMGTYSNGEEITLGQVAIATFPAEGALARVGGNLFSATPTSGDPALGVAGTGGRGSISGYTLEGGNVELETEFVNMIQTQRSYQANARIVSTADETLQELVNLV